MIRFWVFLFFWERWWGRSKNNNNSSNNNVYHILYTYIYIYIHIYHTYIATHIHTFICNNKNNKWYQFPFLWTIFLAPPKQIHESRGGCDASAANRNLWSSIGITVVAVLCYLTSGGFGPNFHWEEEGGSHAQKKVGPLQIVRNRMKSGFTYRTPKKWPNK